jgi:hypothetical protein
MKYLYAITIGRKSINNQWKELIGGHKMKKTITVKGTEIRITELHQSDYFSLTDMIKSFGDESIIANWLRNRNTLEFIGIWDN